MFGTWSSKIQTWKNLVFRWKCANVILITSPSMARPSNSSSGSPSTLLTLAVTCLCLKTPQEQSVDLPFVLDDFILPSGRFWLYFYLFDWLFWLHFSDQSLREFIKSSAWLVCVCLKRRNFLGIVLPVWNISKIVKISLHFSEYSLLNDTSGFCQLFYLMLSWGIITSRHYKSQEIVSGIILAFSDCFMIILWTV